MMKNKKQTFAFYQIYENDALKEYLEEMAQKGWRLKKIGQLLLHFEACEPHPIRYCVEVMEKPSAYASNQTLPLKRYREFCKDAGWDYIGTNGYLHIFYTEDMEALPVETDAQERYERICQASMSGNRTILILFLLVSLLNLGTCYMRRTLLCSSGFVILILMGTLCFYMGDYLLWKRRARASLDASGTLPHRPWPTVRLKNNTAILLILLLCAAFLFYSGGITVKGAMPALLLYLVVYILAMIFFSFLIHSLREKHSFSTTANVLIYWGSALVLITLTLAAGFLFIFRFIF